MTPTERLPSLRGLRTFCRAAEYKSFRQAAEALAVTPSAVSHQIKSLEDELNTPLFVRTKRNVELTPAGEHLYNELKPLMFELGNVVSRFRAPGTQRELRVSVQPFFASEMFVPRLIEFSSQHEHLNIFVDTSDESSEVHPEGMDASIRLFRNVPAHLQADPLFPLELIPACSPGFLERFSSDADKLTRPFPVIVHASRPHAWQNWQKASGIKLQDPSSTLVVDSMIAVARAAERGLGAALVPLQLSDTWFRNQLLVPLFDETVVMEDVFCFVTQAGERSRGDDVAALRNWVIKNFAVSR